MPKTTPKIRIFLDSSALFSGVVSSTGAARALLVLGEAQRLTVVISEQVIAETESALARKIPQALPAYRAALQAAHPEIVPNPSPEEIARHQNLIAHAADIPIVLAAMRARVDFLVTLNRRHFIDDPAVARRSGLRIDTPGDALHWLKTLAGY